jgi:hypothetical protein
LPATPVSSFFSPFFALCDSRVRVPVAFWGSWDGYDFSFSFFSTREKLQTLWL